MGKISLICVYNNQEMVDSMAESCKTQTVGLDNIELVLINNTKGEFKSAAAALNYGADKAQGDKLIFLHQDIEFLREDALEYIEDYLDKNPRALIGAAGVTCRDKGFDGEIVSSMYAGPDKTKYSDEENPREGFVLDECLFGCNRELFKTIRFDEKVCDGWHLYAADLCLQAVINSFEVVILPLPQVWHKSNGNADKAYFATQNELAKKYRKNFKIINTTNSYVYTNPVKRALLNLYRNLKY